MIAFLVIFNIILLLDKKYSKDSKSLIIYVIASFMLTIFFFFTPSWGPSFFVQNMSKKILFISSFLISATYLLYQLYDKQKKELTVPSALMVSIPVLLISNWYLLTFLLLGYLFFRDVHINDKQMMLSKRFILFIMMLISLTLDQLAGHEILYNTILVLITMGMLLRIQSVADVIFAFGIFSMASLISSTDLSVLAFAGIICGLLYLWHALTDEHRERVKLHLRCNKLVSILFYKLFFRFKKSITLPYVEVTGSSKGYRKVLYDTKENIDDANMSYLFLLSILLVLLFMEYMF